jgi:hypothetical protein
MTDAVNWIATLSDGSTAVENTGEYQLVTGERKPWVRLTKFLAENDLHLTSLRLNFRGRTIHMPRANFDRFGLYDTNRAPLFYSLQYHIEKEMTTGVEDHFIDLCSHYENLDVHFIQSLTDPNVSWVATTEGYNPIAPSPRRK